jgi:hypothetical protein
MDSIHMVSDTGIVRAGTELFSRIGIPMSIGLDVFQAATSTNDEAKAFHTVDALVDTVASRIGYVGFGISVVWTIGGGAQGFSQVPYANPDYVFPY